MHLQKIRKISGTIKCLTGLHIGAGRDAVEIGGLDQPIIKHPLTQEPYIPGSSLKGKMRSLMELMVFSKESGKTKEYVDKGKPCQCGKATCPACKIFGVMAGEKTDSELGPTRLIVRDALLTQAWRDSFSDNSLMMEVKYENTIDRVKGVAEHPRPLERVPAGVEFELSMAFKVFDGDGDDLFDYVKKGLKLVQLDALGGNVSRGCGQVLFEDLEIDGESFSLDQIMP